MNKRIFDLKNKGFGRLTVIERAGFNKHGQSLWQCLCWCGTIKIIRHSELTTGHTKSCGCLHKEIMQLRQSENHPMWKNSRKMGAIHNWVKKRKPKPDFCECCGVNPPNDCANISQKYLRDINDYEWLCRRCHQTKDGRMYALKNGERDRKGHFVKDTFAGLR